LIFWLFFLSVPLSLEDIKFWMDVLAAASLNGEDPFRAWVLNSWVDSTAWTLFLLFYKSELFLEFSLTLAGYSYCVSSKKWSLLLDLWLSSYYTEILVLFPITLSNGSSRLLSFLSCSLCQADNLSFSSTIN